MRARKALLPDAPRIRELIALYSGDGTLIPRELPEICENIRDFTVVEEEEAGILACGALHLYGTHLSEVRSISVDPVRKGKGAGRVLVAALLAEASQHQVTCVCLFTRVPQFFARMGFALARHDELPEKIFKDCVKCPRMHACDEIAMVRGRPQPDLRLRARLSPLVMPVRLGR